MPQIVPAAIGVFTSFATGIGAVLSSKIGLGLIGIALTPGVSTVPARDYLEARRNG